MKRLIVSYKGLCFIARQEACVLVPYQDGAHYSIGYGHNDKMLTASSPAITAEQAWALFRKDMRPRELTVVSWLKVPVEQHQFDALTSAYYQKGSKVREVINLVNDGDQLEALALLLTFNRNKGKFAYGLAKRRFEEATLFRKADYGDLSKMKFWDGDPRTTQFKEIPFPLETAT